MSLVSNCWPYLANWRRCSASGQPCSTLGAAWPGRYSTYADNLSTRAIEVGVVDGRRLDKPNAIKKR